MNLKQLETFLNQFPKDEVLTFGFKNPHSYRGYYEQVSFEPAQDVLVQNMLDDVKKAQSRIFQGWKGGAYKYDDDTEVNIAYEGCTDSGALLRLFVEAALCIKVEE